MHDPHHIILAGGTGFLGQVLGRYLTQKGYRITVLTRFPGGQNGLIRQVPWDGRTLDTWTEHLDGTLAVVNLAGRSVNCRYNARNRQLIIESRMESTRVIGQAIKCCRRPPRAWLNASTATIYQHTFGPAWDESGIICPHRDAKDAFSIQVATAWEREVQCVETPLTRKVLLRSAMVLGSGANSVFPVLRRLARCGLGGRMGTGRQYVSWIHELDFCRAVERLIAQEDIAGPVNVAAPNPLPNAEMLRILREVCGVPIGLPAPAWILELGAFLLRTETELVLKSRRVVGKLLMDHGFTFQYARIRDAFADLDRSMES